ncbi:hypothetical protein R1sor_027204 [Riccia sorocarpa]|uniref:Uncharacterized protein n=1 Tax=Riccia sorocarpa TaxID=122646 RepID=A0ABD3GF20_9MARC
MTTVLGSVVETTYDRVFSTMEGKLQSYADAARETQLTLLRDQESERMLHLEAKMREQEREYADRVSRSRNLRIVGLVEKQGEDIQAEVLTLFKEELKVADPQIVQATRVGREGTGPRAILVRFKSVENQKTVLFNRGLLRGKKIWLDPDLMGPTKTIRSPSMKANAVSQCPNPDCKLPSTPVVGTALQA